MDNRGYCDVAWEYLSSCRDALYILRVAGTAKVLGGVRTRSLDGRRPLKYKYFNPNWTEILASPNQTSEPLANIDASLLATSRSAV